MNSLSVRKKATIFGEVEIPEDLSEWFNKEHLTNEWKVEYPGSKYRNFYLNGVKVTQYESRCMDCNENYWPMFTIKDNIWLSVFDSKKGQICFECFEKRLGRNIICDDLRLDAKCNKIWEIYIKYRELTSLPK